MSITEKQKEADRRYRERHPEKCKEKDRRRYLENKETELVRNASYYMRNRDAQRIKHRNRRHQITQEWFDKKLVEQNNCCAICNMPLVDTPHIDHNHKCCPPLRSCDKCRRDLLCKDCNLGLGRFKDNIEVLQKAIQYLQRHNNDSQS